MTISVGAVSFNRNPSAPARSALMTCSSAWNVVRTITCGGVVRRRRAAVAAMPSIPGIRMSIRTTSGRCACTAATPSAPSTASPTEHGADREMVPYGVAASMDAPNPDPGGGVHPRQHPTVRPDRPARQPRRHVRADDRDRPPSQRLHERPDLQDLPRPGHTPLLTRLASPARGRPSRTRAAPGCRGGGHAASGGGDCLSQGRGGVGCVCDPRSPVAHADERAWLLAHTGNPLVAGPSTLRCRDGGCTGLS